MEIKERISKLRDLMENHKVEAYIVPSSDPHLSEYVGEHFKARAWISGFTGSAGTVVFTKHKAGLWTDGRYYIQAEKQLQDSGIELFKAAEIGTPTYTQWLKEELKEGETVGFDGMLFSASAAEKLEKELQSKEVKINSTLDLISPIWIDRPEVPSDEVFIHDTKYCGLSREEKLNKVREVMKNLGGNYYLLSSLDDICWLFNIRGNDIPNNPFIISYSLVGEKEAFIFVDKNKVNPNVEQELMIAGVIVKEYEEIYSFLKAIEDTASVIIDYNNVNYSLVSSVNKDAKKINEPNLTTMIKAIKSQVEVENMKEAYIKDGAALVRLFKWIKENTGTITEVDVVKKAEELRRTEPLCLGPSFDSIACYRENAAMMHYNPYNEEIPVTLEKQGFFLLDSGGQYLKGTTDITRTIVLGDLTEEEKRDFTLVLKSVIALSTAKFLYGTTGSNLDILARKPLWEQGLDYKCGTGHGIGFLGSVHEMPQRFSQVPNTIKLEKGMVLTIEPGVYKEGRHGVRTENTVIVAEGEKTEFGQFMYFEDLCYVPVDLSAVVKEMLTDFEIKWLNSYHEKVYQLLSPHLDEQCKKWLLEETRAI